MPVSEAEVECAVAPRRSLRVAIVDLDAHCGDGTQSLTRALAAELGLREHAFAQPGEYMQAADKARAQALAEAATAAAAPSLPTIEAQLSELGQAPDAS